MKIVGDNTIEKMVMAVVRSKIATSQKKYDEKCREFEEETQKQKDLLDIKLKDDKDACAKELVENIVGKLIQ